MQTVAQSFDSVNVRAILTAAGYSVRGRNRANCPNCSGHSRLTVSFTNDGRFFCHRCGKGGHVRSLARNQGIELPAPRIRLSDVPKNQFRVWLSQKMSEMSSEEYKLTRRWRYAVAALQSFPEMDHAWQALADYYHKQRYFELFWESASDRCGRYWIYRAWRRHYAR